MQVAAAGCTCTARTPVLITCSCISQLLTALWPDKPPTALASRAGHRFPTHVHLKVSPHDFEPSKMGVDKHRVKSEKYPLPFIILYILDGNYDVHGLQSGQLPMAKPRTSD